MNAQDIVIGSSRAAAALGLDPFMSPMAFYAEVLGVGDENEDEDSEAAFIGRHVEHALATMFEEEHEVKLTRCDPMLSLEHPWLRATPDRIIMFDDMSVKFRKAWGIEPGECMLWEGKTAGLKSSRPQFMLDQQWGTPGSDKIPAKYAVQTQLQARVVNETFNEMGAGFVTRVIVHALVAGQGNPVFIVPQRPDIQDHLVGELERFMKQHLIPEVPPTPETIEDWKAYIEAKRRKQESTELLNATPEDIALATEYKVTREMRKELELAEERMRAQLIERIGNHYGIAWANKDGVGNVLDSGRVLYTAGKETVKLRHKAFATDLIPMLEAESRSENPARRKLAETIIDLAKKHTKTTFTTRQLRATFTEGNKPAKEEG